MFAFLYVFPFVIFSFFFRYSSSPYANLFLSVIFGIRKNHLINVERESWFFLNICSSACEFDDDLGAVTYDNMISSYS